MRDGVDTHMNLRCCPWLWQTTSTWSLFGSSNNSESITNISRSTFSKSNSSASRRFMVEQLYKIYKYVLDPWFSWSTSGVLCKLIDPWSQKKLPTTTTDYTHNSLFLFLFFSFPPLQLSTLLPTVLHDDERVRPSQPCHRARSAARCIARRRRHPHKRMEQGERFFCIFSLCLINIRL
jgi:hypothetical protein